MRERPLISITGPAMFWLLCIIIVLCGTYMWKVKPPADPNPLRYTQEERMVRAMRDPLALRLYAIGEMSWGSSTAKSKAIEQVIQQWEKEVTEMAENAYVRTGWGAEKASWEVEKPVEVVETAQVTEEPAGKDEWK